MAKALAPMFMSVDPLYAWAMIELTFHGAAQTVTGSCMELLVRGRRILVDCGLFQGSRTLERLNHEPFAFRPEGVDAVILTHAHIDHSGLLPRLVKDGFNGPIWTTAPTRDLLAYMLADSARIGERVRLGPGCTIGEHAELGEDTWLHGGVTIYPYCVLGRRVIVNAGSVIGADGFGGVLDQGRWLKMPHVGRVVIGDDVEIGANTTVDRGAIDDTVIAEGVKIDNLVQIGHNVRIGAHTAIAGCVGIAGSATIGARCQLAGQTGIAGHLSICDDVVLTARALVANDITEPGVYSCTIPVEKFADWRRILARLKRLDILARRVNALQRRGGAAGGRDDEEDA